VTVIASLLALAPLSIAIAAFYFIGMNDAEEVIEDDARRQLIAIRETRKAHIEDYFLQIRRQVKAFSNDRMIINAMREFKQAFASVDETATAKSKAELYSELETYYERQFGQEYQALNAGKRINTTQLLERLDEESLRLQSRYILHNSHPLGEKYRLDDAGDNSRYSRLHRQYHPHIRYFLEQFDYYDIFLVAPDSGDIVYSVFKELDFATSLIDGPYANTGIAEAFRVANRMQDRNGVALVDFAPYTPSYESAASFIASPIYDGDEKLGILIFQMPIGHINDIMTSKGRWRDMGLGISGETYLVGKDFKARSISRFLLDDKESYLSLLLENGTSGVTIDEIKARSSNIGLQTIQTPATEAALAGKSGFGVFAGYRNVEVLSAYAPINIDGLTWAIVSEIEKNEAFSGATKMTRKVGVVAIVIFVIIAVIALFAGRLFAGSLTRPIRTLSKVIQDVERDNDLTKRVVVESRDEVGEMATAFNNMLANFERLIRRLSESMAQLAGAAEKLSAITGQTSAGVNRQRSETDQLATAMNQMAATVREVALSASDAAESAQKSSLESGHGQNAMEQTVQAMKNLSEKLACSGLVIDQLSKDSEQIGAVLVVIKGVAEQTNLLALNAAIEAARAGEQGRGFAVVADEVRTLAQRTQASTDEIQKIIEGLQTSAGEAVNAMEESREHAAETIAQSERAKTSLTAITASVSMITDKNTQIASAAEEQSCVAEEINRNVSNISQISEETAQGAGQTAISSNELARLGEELRDMISQFKVS